MTANRNSSSSKSSSAAAAARGRPREAAACSESGYEKTRSTSATGEHTHGRAASAEKIGEARPCYLEKRFAVGYVFIADRAAEWFARSSGKKRGEDTRPRREAGGFFAFAKNDNLFGLTA